MPIRTGNRRSKSGKLFQRRSRLELLESRHLLTSVSLTPVADTYTRAGVNAGTSQTLDTTDNGGGDYMAYIRFDLTGVDLNSVNNAYLILQRVSGATMNSDRFDVYGLANLSGNTPQNWNESTLATAGLGQEYTNTSGNSVDLTRVVDLNSEGLRTDGTGATVRGPDVIEQVNDTNNPAPQMLQGVDVVKFLKTRQADGGLATFIVTIDAGVVRTFTYGSRENSDAALRPQLRLDYVPSYAATPVNYPRQVETLNRGVIAERRATSEVYVGWRMFGTDPSDVSFNVYRSANGGAAVKLNSSPITTSTNFVDTTFNSTLTNLYTVRPIINGVEQAGDVGWTLAANAPVQQYLGIPLQIPPGGQSPDVNNPGQFVSYTYTANDATVADLDGDGQYEIILKWMPTNEQGAGTAGYTGPMIMDAYRLDGTRLWRINLGINIRSGPQYSAFTAYDFDGDGKAEFVCRTMPGTVDGLGNNVILPGDDPNADYRDSSGRITTGPEYLTVFNGMTGAAMVTVPYLPDRQDISTWGDTYGHRGENIMIAPAYLDGVHPSIVIGRGVFGPASGVGTGRDEVTAWDFQNNQLTLRWWFKADVGQNNNINSEYIAQANYTFIPADVDGDGKDEIVYGNMVVDDNGTGLYSTGRGHGDALHVGDFDLSNPGLEVFMPHETTSLGNHVASEIRDAATGKLLAGPLVTIADVQSGAFPDVGRGIALDIDPNYPGYEFWDSYDTNIYDSHGNIIYAKPSNMHQNFGVWWDGDPLRETLDNTTIGDWNYTTHGRSNLVSFANSGINNSSGLSANNGTKSTPCLSGDILGDWREEVVWRKSDNTELQIWSTTTATTYRYYTLTHDTQYREALAWQNVGYNQPPNPSFFLGMLTPTTASTAPTANIYDANGPKDIQISSSSIAEHNAVGAVIGNLSSVASGSASTYTYSLVNAQEANDNSAFSVVGNQLKANIAFNFTTKSTYHVRVRTTDATGKVMNKTLTISIIDVPDIPVVTNTNDSGSGSLRQAILDVNAGTANPATIQFAISGSGLQSIQLVSNLPNLSYSTILDIGGSGSVGVGTANNFTFSEFSALTITNGALTLGGTQSHATATTVTVSSGSLTLNSDIGANATIIASAPVTFNSTQHLAVLTVNNGNTAALTGGGGKALVLGGLTLNGTAKLNLANNNLIVHATAGTQTSVLNAISAAIASGFSPGVNYWSGSGIHSASAAGDFSRLTALGVIANVFGASPRYTTFAGQTVVVTDVLVKYTYYGDANLDGAVTGADYALTDNGSNFLLSGWINGDFSYDGHVNGADYALIDNAFNFQSAPLASSSLTPLSLSLSLPSSKAASATDAALIAYLVTSPANGAPAEDAFMQRLRRRSS